MEKKKIAIFLLFCLYDLTATTAPPPMIVSEWVKCVYLKDDCIWTVKTHPDDPWTWRKLLKARDYFYDHVRVVVGDGRSTSLFFDKWLPSGAILERQACLVRKSATKIQIHTLACNTKQAKNKGIPRGQRYEFAN